MKAHEILQGLMSLTDTMNDPETCDTYKAGDPEREVTKVAVTMTATVDVLREVADWGAELLIVHEPLYYDHFDRPSEEPQAAAKRKLVEDTGMTVFRYHDYSHATLPDVIVEGQLRKMGLVGKDDRPGVCARIRVVLDTPTTPVELAKQIEERLNIKHVRICGVYDVPCTKVSVMVGAADVHYEIREDECEILITGETGEWCIGEYARDAAQMGKKKALLLLGHIGSERDGMEYTTAILKDMFPSLDIRYFDCGELFRYTDGL